MEANSSKYYLDKLLEKEYYNLQTKNLISYKAPIFNVSPIEKSKVSVTSNHEHRQNLNKDFEKTIEKITDKKYLDKSGQQDFIIKKLRNYSNLDTFHQVFTSNNNIKGFNKNKNNENLYCTENNILNECKNINNEAQKTTNKYYAINSGNMSKINNKSPKERLKTTVPDLSPEKLSNVVKNDLSNFKKILAQKNLFNNTQKTFVSTLDSKKGGHFKRDLVRKTQSVLHFEFEKLKTNSTPSKSTLPLQENTNNEKEIKACLEGPRKSTEKVYGTDTCNFLLNYKATNRESPEKNNRKKFEILTRSMDLKKFDVGAAVIFPKKTNNIDKSGFIGLELFKTNEFNNYHISNNSLNRTNHSKKNAVRISDTTQKDQNINSESYSNFINNENLVSKAKSEFQSNEGNSVFENSAPVKNGCSNEFQVLDIKNKPMHNLEAILSTAKSDKNSKNTNKQQNTTSNKTAKTKQFFSSRFLTDVSKYGIDIGLFYNPFTNEDNQIIEQNVKESKFSKTQNDPQIKNPTTENVNIATYTKDLENIVKPTIHPRKKSDSHPYIESLFDSKVVLSHRQRSIKEKNKNLNGDKPINKFFNKTFTGNIFSKYSNKMVENCINNKKNFKIPSATSLKSTVCNFPQTEHDMLLGWKKLDSGRSNKKFINNYYKNYNENKNDLKKPQSDKFDDTYDQITVNKMSNNKINNSCDFLKKNRNIFPKNEKDNFQICEWQANKSQFDSSFVYDSRE